MFHSSNFSKQDPVFHSLADAQQRVHGGGPQTFGETDEEQGLNESLSHAHQAAIPLESLLTQLDQPRESRRSRDTRPQWLRDMADCVTDLFEPLAHVGRVGFDCVPKQGRWHLSFYLAAAEHIGGPLDGHVEAINFQFDIATLLKCFERVDKCDWQVFPTPEAIGVDEVSRTDIPRGLSSVRVEGVMMTETGLAEPVAIEIHSLPPATSNVGLKLFADGDVAPID